MGKALQVVVVFEFAGIESPDSPEADQIVDELTYEVERLVRSEWQSPVDWDSISAWVDDARIREEEV
jgi:hypothetical protein